MDFKLTDDKVFEVAKRYGLEVKKSETPGFYINGKNIEVDDLFRRLFGETNFEEVPIENLVNGDFEITRVNTELKYKDYTANFDKNTNEVA